MVTTASAMAVETIPNVYQLSQLTFTLTSLPI